MHLKTTFIGAPSEHVFQSELNLAIRQPQPTDQISCGIAESARSILLPRWSIAWTTITQCTVGQKRTRIEPSALGLVVTCPLTFVYGHRSRAVVDGVEQELICGAHLSTELWPDG